MSYNNPLDTAIQTSGLDGTITSLQSAMSAFSWIDKSFHRAYRHTEESEATGRRTKSIPKCWQANNEWIDVSPNDNITAQSFFWSDSSEDVAEFDKHVSPLMEADISLIVWINTSKLSGHITGPSVSEQKADVINLLTNHDLVVSIDSIVDRSADEIFDPFTMDDERTHYTMLPFQGFRVNFRVKFTYDQCSVISS
jgi:hypothetical protein